ncbi:MAG TPA: Gfo/Idh/MocA family oxidoreductase [Phycisphaerae bacterium]|nr:Gfo/Idh/MocA family oxidoreductase [Phycisphaerae bacterium]
MIPEPIPVAVIGVGHMGRHHARLYNELPQSRLVAVVDSNPERAKECAAQHKCAGLTSIQELPEDVRAVTIAVPTIHHVAVAEPLLSRGIAVLVEKPLADSVEAAERLLACGRKTGSLISVGHTERFNPVIRAIQRLNIRPKYIETQRISPFRFRSADIGVVADMMIHDIDIVLHLVGSPVARVDAVGVNVLAKHEDVANARVVFQNGAVASLVASRLAMKTDRRLRVFSETAYLSLDYQRKSGVAITRDANLDVLALAKDKKLDDLADMANVDFGQLVKVEPLVMDDVEPLRAELESFLESVRSGKPPAVSAEDGVEAVRLASHIVEAIQAHRWDT